MREQRLKQARFLLHNHTLLPRGPCADYLKLSSSYFLTTNLLNVRSTYLITYLPIFSHIVNIELHLLEVEIKIKYKYTP